MKKTFKFGLGVLILGVILALIGVLSGQNLGVVFKDMRPVLYSDYKKKSYHAYRQNLDATAIKSMTLDLKNTDLTIKRGAKLALRYHSWGSKPDVNIINGNLNIKQSGEDRFVDKLLVFSFGDWENRNKAANKLELTIPENFSLDDVRLVLDSGYYNTNVMLDGFKAKNITLIGSSYALKIANSSFDQFNLDLSGTNITVANSILLSGRITADANLLVNSSTLKDVAVVGNNDIQYSNVSLDSGSLISDSSNIKMSNSSIANGYQITNTTGTTTVLNTTVDGYWLIGGAKSASLNLFGKTGQGELTQNQTTPNCLKITTQESRINVK